MVVLVLGAGLVAGTTLTVAAFTSSTSGGAAVRAGDVVFTVSPAGTIVDTSSMKPGDTRAGTVTLTNQQAPASFALTFTGLGTATLASVLQLTVAQTSPVSRQLYSGALSAVPVLSLGTVSSGSGVGLRLTFAWPAASRDAALQGQSIPLVLRWDAQT